MKQMAKATWLEPECKCFIIPIIMDSVQMRRFKIENCLSKDWKYCPYCGMVLELVPREVSAEQEV